MKASFSRNKWPIRPSIDPKLNPTKMQKMTKMKLNGWGLPDNRKTELGYDDAAAADNYFEAELVELPVSERIRTIDAMERLEAALKAMKLDFSVVTTEFIERLKQLASQDDRPPKNMNRCGVNQWKGMENDAANMLKEPG